MTAGKDVWNGLKWEAVTKARQSGDTQMILKRRSKGGTRYEVVPYGSVFFNREITNSSRVEVVFIYNPKTSIEDLLRRGILEPLSGEDEDDL